MFINPFKHTYVPSEASAIAAEFREAAGYVRAAAQKMRDQQRNLDGSWEGLAKIAFITRLSPFPIQLENYAQWLEQQANVIENMTVTEWKHAKGDNA